MGSKGSRFDPEKAAEILVEAAYKGDKATAEAHGITDRTIRNWKKRLDDDAEFSAVFHLKRRTAEKEWADELPESIRACINFLKDAAKSEMRVTPDGIHAVAGALKVMAEVAIVKDALDVRLAKQNRQHNQAD